MVRNIRHSESMVMTLLIMVDVIVSRNSQVQIIYTSKHRVDIHIPKNEDIHVQINIHKHHMQPQPSYSSAMALSIKMAQLLFQDMTLVPISPSFIPREITADILQRLSPRI